MANTLHVVDVGGGYGSVSGWSEERFYAEKGLISGSEASRRGSPQPFLLFSTSAYWPTYSANGTCDVF